MFLKKKLGPAGFKKFQEGMRLAAAGKSEKAPKADVAGQSSCFGSCASYCDSNSFLSAGAYGRFSFWLPPFPRSASSAAQRHVMLSEAKHLSRDGAATRRQPVGSTCPSERCFD